MSSLTQLEYVLAVDRYRHFGKAAAACRVTQPTLSQQLKLLEDELGAPIFDRSKKPILPTEAGQAIIEQARVVLSEMRKLKEAARGAEKEPHGELRVAVIPTLSPYIVPRFLERFSEKYPKVRLQLQELQTNRIVEALDRDEIDAGLLVTPLGNPSIEEEILFYEPFFVYAHEEHPLAKRKSIHEDDLDARDVWLLQEGHCFRNQIMRVCSLPKRAPKLKGIQFESGSLETLKRLVDEIGGYTLLPELATEKIAIDPHARLVPFSKPYPTREVSLIFRRTQWKRKLLDALAGEIRASVPERLKTFTAKELHVIGIS